MRPLAEADGRSGPPEIHSAAGLDVRGLLHDAASPELRGDGPLLAPIGSLLPHLDSNQEPAD